MEAKAIDLSVHNNTVDFNRVKAAGINNVILRCGFTGYGKSHTLNKDITFEENYRKAKEAGLNVGAYYYAVALTEADADREAAFVLSLLKGKQFELPIYYDVEDSHDTSSSSVLSENMQNLGKSKLTSIVDRFCSTVESAGYYTGFYTSTYWVNQLLDMSILNRYTLWLAQWSDKVTYTGSYGIWQYTDSGSVDGVSGNVDMNIIYEDFTSVIKKLGLNGFEKTEFDYESTVAEKPAEEPEDILTTGEEYYVQLDFYRTKKEAEEARDKAIQAGFKNAAVRVLGDIDGDDKVTSADARTVLRKSVGLD